VKGRKFFNSNFQRVRKTAGAGNFINQHPRSLTPSAVLTVSLAPEQNEKNGGLIKWVKIGAHEKGHRNGWPLIDSD
jgi:hypothetical protein